MSTNQSQVISAARFQLYFESLGPAMAFSELGGITSKVSPSEYTYNDDQGNTHITKQFGKTEPPTVTLKRGLDVDGNARLLAWHGMARLGQEGARGNGHLTVKDAGGGNEITYNLVDAWCSEVIVSGMKAGANEVSTIEVKIVCAEIIVPKK